MPVRLHVNVDHVATVRNARGTRYPDPVYAAQVCEAAGAEGITAHLREDRRHIRDDDVARLRATISTRLNLEMAATEEMCGIAETIRPDVVTLVPERRAERTTEGGLDLEKERAGVERVVAMAKPKGVKVSLFIDPDVATVERAKALGADQIELHTGEYCHAWAELPAPDTRPHIERELARLRAAAQKGHALGLEVAAGHGLTRHNVGPVVQLPEVVEVNIGHAIIADAIFLGLERAVAEMRAAIVRARSARVFP